MNIKEPVRLRQRRTPTGLISLYLDIYEKGHRTYEYLRLYLVPEKTRADKEKNKQTLQLADAIRAKRVVELRNGQYGFRSFKPQTLFFDYFLSYIERKKKKNIGGSKTLCCQACYQHLIIYERRKSITFSEITPEWVEGFKRYLQNDAVNIRKLKGTKLSYNSAWAYYQELRSCIKEAVSDGIITENPARRIDTIRRKDAQRMYLTIDEVKLLAKTECSDEDVKSMFLFSCLTGLRHSDIKKMKWREVHQQGEFTRIIFTQQKTSGQEYLDITAEAAALMGERKGDDEAVFNDVFCLNKTNSVIKDWVARAGITKYITFHCARHTFATMMLDLGTDLFTVSKLLGHREISTTQIYAKVLDKNKQAAVAKIPSIIK
ncbi:MAG: site-specific integrase [Paludibacteraceae bacterium]|nr:site-specific integrase [Paludibacteraceae bacterium]MBQ6963537.1 site-specific integrase [Paludibacteraceae bacterium]MBQ7662449.1 site-specific integrase [Prevotella sp.]MBQ7748328.1 site-specific integrase [Paludibacteraceae bacterium]